MKKDYTHFTFVLDRSGSMSHSIVETIQGINNFIEKNKINGKTATYSLYSFSDEIKEHNSFIDINSYNKPDIIADGMTALFDAFVISIDKTGDVIHNMKEEDRPEKVIMVTLTDGCENSSKNFKINHVKSRIEEQKTKYNWDFIFLGADFNIDNYATSFGLSKNTSRNVSKFDIDKSLESVGESLSLYRNSGYAPSILNESLEKIGE